MIDQEVKEAINQATRNAGQSPELAAKLITWLESVADGNESLTNTTRYTERCSICFDTVSVENSEE